jgi:cysteine-rich repeat protein
VVDPVVGPVVDPMVVHNLVHNLVHNMKTMTKTLIKIIAILVILSLFPIITFADNYCGDGILDTQVGEECDDGNFVNRDGCSNYCKIEDMTPPAVVSVSIAEGAADIPTTTNEFIIAFSEPVDPATINQSNIKLNSGTVFFNLEFNLKENGTDAVISTEDDLFGESEHTISVKNIKDILGNQMKDIFVRNFTTGVYIDHTPPNIVIEPPGGHYNVAQSIKLTPYIGKETWSKDFLDKDAVIYYTLDGSIPTTNSVIYETAISIKDGATLKYFGIDKKGNRSYIKTETYTFSCGERLHATKVSSYPSCQIQECDYGFELKSNVCVMRLGESADDYKINAATAPLFGSDTPMTISTKPSLYITPEHNGIIPRPIIFKDLERGTTLYFERDTKITRKSGETFTGYLKPPYSLYTKDFPINFGYTFKSIFKFEPYDEDELFFDPAYKITIPFTESYDKGELITVFTYDPETELYSEYGRNLVSVNEADETVTIIAHKTDVFFVAQAGKNYNKAVFSDTIGHWARNYIEALYRKGIVKGRDEGIFAPDELLTRAEFTKIALKSIGIDIDLNEETKRAPFYDVPLYAWYAPYIAKAKELGLINGYPDDSFKPDQPINKAEAVKILMNAFGFDITSAGKRTDSYRDILSDQWYFLAVNFAIKNGLADGKRLTNGVTLDYLFGPGENITRGEMAKMAIKTIEFKESLLAKNS